MAEKGLFILHADGSRTRIDAITSDTHFGHKNIAKHTGRPFDNSSGTYHMDSTLINNWNSVVAEDEMTLHLGDVALGSVAQTLDSIAKCNGRKVLIPGNHDQISSFVTKSRKERFMGFYTAVFETILEETGNRLVAVKNGWERELQASHYPSYGDSHDRNEHLDTPDAPDRYEKLRPAGNSLPIVHGHTHSKDVFFEDAPGEFHVGVEAHALHPIRDSVIVDWVFSL